MGGVRWALGMHAGWSTVNDRLRELRAEEAENDWNLVELALPGSARTRASEERRARRFLCLSLTNDCILRRPDERVADGSQWLPINVSADETTDRCGPRSRAGRSPSMRATG